MNADFNYLINKSWSCFPELSCSCTQRGCLPLPDHVSDGSFGLRYFGKTDGYGLRFLTVAFDLLPDPRSVAGGSGVRSSRRFLRQANSLAIFSANMASILS